MKHADLVIIGGGMTGLTLTAALRPSIEAGLSVSVIDPASAPIQAAPSSPSFDDRATALSQNTLDILTTLGIKNIDEFVSDIVDIEVSDAGHGGYHYMASQDQDRQRFGSIIANRSLGSLLWQQCQNLPVDFQFSQRVSAIKPMQDGHTVELSNGETLHSSLLILCDGGRSTLAQQLGFHRTHQPFNALARIATVKTEYAHQGRAFERFTPNGPIALLPFGHFSALVWTIPEPEANQYPSTKTSALAWLNDHFGQRLGRITDISQWYEYPLEESRTVTIAGHHCLVLGNAAATLHPVAGQGFNLAIRGVTRSALQINDTYLSENTLPTFAAFNQIAHDIIADQQTTMLASRSLIKLFGASNPIIQLGRNVGLNSLDRHPVFSQLFALAGMGYLSGAPSL